MNKSFIFKLQDSSFNGLLVDWINMDVWERWVNQENRVRGQGIHSKTETGKSETESV